MKIALNIYKFGETKGGVERYAWDLSHGLVNRGYEVHIFTHKWMPPEVKGITFHKVPAFSLFKSFKLLSFAKNSFKMLVKEKFDIIHGFSRTYYQDIYRVGGGCHKEYLKAVNSSISFSDRVILRLEKKTFTNDAYKFITCISEKCKKEIIEHYKIPPEKIKVIYNGIDTKKFNVENVHLYRKKIRRQYMIGDDEFVILFVGSGFERKGLLYAINAVAEFVKETNAKFFVLGRGNYAHYRNIVGKLGLAGKVFILGQNDHPEEFYAASDVFLLPTLYEPFGTVCLEAMATGLPVITTMHAGASEIIQHGENGFVIQNVKEPIEIVQTLKILINKDPYTRISQNSLTTAGLFTIEKNIEETLKVYEAVMNIKESQ